MRGNGHVFAHVDWQRMDEAQLDGMRYVAYTPTGVVDGRFAPMPTRNGLPMPYLVDEAIGFPVILLTARSRESDVDTGYASGANEYIVKPFSPRELLHRVAAVVGRG